MLQPIPETTYIRVVYVGTLQLVNKDGSSMKNAPTLEEMIEDIWKVASVYNRSKFISGELCCSKTLHVAQLLEGKEEIVLGLMKRIRKDPRVEIYKEFDKKQLSMHLGWATSMCYSFEITSAQRGLVEDTDLTMEDMFDMMKNTYEVRQEGFNPSGFYKEIIKTILLKFISITEGEKSAKLESSLRC